MRREVDLGDRKVTIVGTAHVSKESREEVKNTIEEENPDLVCVELDENRFESLRQDSGWKDLNVTEAMRNGDGKLLLLNLLLSIYQRRIGLQEGMKPGEELMAAIDMADERSIEYALIDRDINVTLGRAISSLSLWEKMKILASFMAAQDEVTVEDLKENSVLNSLIEELEEEFPSISRVFLEERNNHMAERVLEKDFEKAVVVVGAAHVSGLADNLSGQIETIEEESSRSIPWFKAIKYGLPLFIISGLLYSFFKIGFSTGVNATGFWILSNGILAMLGAILARSHIKTWAISFMAAPLTSLDPALGAGMVASYFEAKFHPPTVEELEDIVYIEKYRELWGNQMGRILLTFAFVTLGSAAATFISAGYIASLIG